MYIKIVELILTKIRNYDNVSYQISTPMHLAAASGSLEIFELLLKHTQGDKNPKTKKTHNTSLHYAAQNGRLEMAQFIFQNVEDSFIENKMGHTPLHFAIKHGHLNIVEYFLEKIVVTDKMLLYSILHCSNFKIFKLLFDAKKGKKNPTFEQGKTLLHFAVEKAKSLETTKYILENMGNEDKYPKDEFRKTPMHYAYCLKLNDIASLWAPNEKGVKHYLINLFNFMK